MNFYELNEQVQLGKDFSEVTIKYVPLMSQKVMIDNIKSICLKEDTNGLLKVDYILKDLFTILYISVNYTNIEFNDLYDEEYNINTSFAFEIYDFFKEYGFYQILLNRNECKDFVSMLENEIHQEVKNKNSVSSVLSQVLNNIANKLPSENSIKSVMNDIPVLLNTINKQPKKKNSSKKIQG